LNSTGTQNLGVERQFNTISCGVNRKNREQKKCRFFHAERSLNLGEEETEHDLAIKRGAASERARNPGYAPPPRVATMRAVVQTADATFRPKKNFAFRMTNLGACSSSFS
jgi:hypothetical protein